MAETTKWKTIELNPMNPWTQFGGIIVGGLIVGLFFSYFWQVTTWILGLIVWIYMNFMKKKD